MWRVILRISYTGDFGSGLRNNIVPIFQALGLSVYIACVGRLCADRTEF